jgi:hypothetical protein
VINQILSLRPLERDWNQLGTILTVNKYTNFFSAFRHFKKKPDILLAKTEMVIDIDISRANVDHSGQEVKNGV